MEMQEDNRVNLIVASRKEVTTNLQEQTIQFEITAAPPPPETMARIRSLPPNLSLVLAPADRETVHNAVRAILAEGKRFVHRDRAKPVRGQKPMRNPPYSSTVNQTRRFGLGNESCSSFMTKIATPTCSRRYTHSQTRTALRKKSPTGWRVYGS